MINEIAALLRSGAGYVLVALSALLLFGGYVFVAHGTDLQGFASVMLHIVGPVTAGGILNKGIDTWRNGSSKSSSGSPSSS